MSETVKIILSIIGGATGTAIVNALYNRWRFRAERRAAKEDRAEEKSDAIKRLQDDYAKMSKAINELVTQQEAQSEALKLILLDLILKRGLDYIAAGEITLDDRTRFHTMHSCYHNGLRGNGDADLVVSAVDELPLKTK